MPEGRKSVGQRQILWVCVNTVEPFRDSNDQGPVSLTPGTCVSLARRFLDRATPRVSVTPWKRLEGTQVFLYKWFTSTVVSDLPQAKGGETLPIERPQDGRWMALWPRIWYV